MAKSDEGIALELAGMADDGGRIGRRFAGDSYRIPASPSFKNGRMYWRPSFRVRHIEAERGLVERFAALANASNVAIDRFRKSHGPLNLCQHGWPVEHLAGRATQPCFLVGEADPAVPEAGESADAWRPLAAAVGSALKIAAALHLGAGAREDDWARITPHVRPNARRLEATHLAKQLRQEPPSVSDTVGKTRAEEWLVLTRYANKWLAWTDVRLAASWSIRGGPALRLQPRDLAGVIAVQLASAICRADTIRSCRACGELFLIAPRVGRPPLYCDDCGPKARDRIAHRVKGVGGEDSGNASDV